MKSAIRVFAVILLALLGTSFASHAQQAPKSQDFEKGRSEAKHDVTKGLYKPQAVRSDLGVFGPTFCHFPSQDDLYESILKDKYQIETNLFFIADVGNWDDVVEYADGYNEISRPAIKSKYGADIFDNAGKQAASVFETKYGENERKCKEWHAEFRKMVMSLPKKQPK